MRESIERIRKKSTLEKLEEIKGKEMKRMKEDKTSGPWLHIEPKHLTEDAQKLFDLFKNGDLEAAQEQLKRVSEEMGKIKDEKVRSSNERFVQWIDDQIGIKILAEKLEEEREKE